MRLHLFLEKTFKEQQWLLLNEQRKLDTVENNIK